MFLEQARILPAFVFVLLLFAYVLQITFQQQIHDDRIPVYYTLICTITLSLNIQLASRELNLRVKELQRYFGTNMSNEHREIINTWNK